VKTDEQSRNSIDSGALEQRIPTLRWKYAKTYPDAPHEYILQSWDREIFAYFQGKLNTESVEEEFTLRGRTNSYRYYYPGDGYRYWIIQEVLNRCRVENTKGGDDLCPPGDSAKAD
jgi:hypothetical protein